MDVRPADAHEVDALAAIWHDGWHDAHAMLVPPALVALRTRESFAPRVAAALGALRAVGPPGAPAGLCIVRGDELQHLYVMAAARGTGAAAKLLEDAESRIATGGATLAWLSCAIGNLRAARFYEKHGWSRAGTMTYEAEIAGGTFPLEVWRYERTLSR